MLEGLRNDLAGVVVVICRVSSLEDIVAPCDYFVASNLMCKVDFGTIDVACTITTLAA